MVNTMVILAYTASAASVVFLGIVIVRRGRLTPASIALLALIVSILWWIAMSAWGALARPEDLTVLLAWTMPASASVVASVRILVWALSDPSWRPDVRTFVTMSGHPVATVLAASIPQLRELVVADTGDGLQYGPAFWVHVAVSYILLLSAFLEIGHARSRIPLVARGHVATLVVAWAVPLTVSMVKIAFIEPGRLDITPLGFAVTAGALYVAVVHGGFADLAPVARHQVFEHLVDAVFVIDARGNLVDTNAKARALAGLDEQLTTMPHTSFQEVFPALATVAGSPGEHDIVIGGTPLVLDIATTDLTDPSGRYLGLTVRARDITQSALQRRELARIHNALEREASANEELRAELADQAMRDQGTGLHNRRYIMDLLPELVAECERDSVPLSIALVDLDHFKTVNDTWGHSVGDRVLSAAAKAMASAAPPGVIARFGGEEFIALLPGLTAEEAAARADAIRAACAAVEVQTREGVITVTASAGVASAAPGNIDASKLIDAADAALYRAKAADRDRTWVAGSV